MLVPFAPLRPRRLRRPDPAPRHTAAAPRRQVRTPEPPQLAARRMEPALHAAGVATFEIARMAGTRVLQIEKTYRHLLPDAIECGRAALEAFDARPGQAFGQLSEAFGQLSGNADLALAPVPGTEKPRVCGAFL